MASKYRVGIGTKPDTGETFPVELNNVRRTVRYEWSKAVGEDGKQSERRAKSKIVQVVFDGTFLAAYAGILGNGGVLKIGTKDYAITDYAEGEPAGDYNTCSATCERVDDEAIVPYAEAGA